jgi:hypothetical protein
MIKREQKKKKKEKSTSAIPYSLSSPFRHEKENNHHMNWEGFNVIWRDNNPNKLLLKETLVIKAPDQSRPAVNGRAPTNYDGKRQPFTLAVYSNHIRCSAVYYNHRKQ